MHWVIILLGVVIIAIGSFLIYHGVTNKFNNNETEKVVKVEDSGIVYSDESGEKSKVKWGVIVSLSVSLIALVFSGINLYQVHFKTPELQLSIKALKLGEVTMYWQFETMDDPTNPLNQLSTFLLFDCYLSFRSSRPVLVMGFDVDALVEGEWVSFKRRSIDIDKESIGPTNEGRFEFFSSETDLNFYKGTLDNNQLLHGVMYFVNRGMKNEELG